MYKRQEMGWDRITKLLNQNNEEIIQQIEKEKKQISEEVKQREELRKERMGYLREAEAYDK